SPHPCSGAQAPLSRFPTILVDVTHELPEVLRIGIGPRKPRVVRTGTVSRDYPTNTQRITVSRIDYTGVATPIGSDGRESTGHGLQNGHAPPLPSTRRNEAVRRTIQRRQLVVRKLAVVDQMNATAVLVELQGPDPVRNVVPIAAHDLTDQHRRLAAAKRGVE